MLFVLIGLHGWRYSAWQGFEVRFQGVYIGVAVIGLGSAAFHATLLKVAQQCDETPMIWSVLCWLYLLYEPDWSEADHYYKHLPADSKQAVVGSRYRRILDHGSAAAAKLDSSSLFWILRTVYGPVDRAEHAARRMRCSRVCCNRYNRTIAIWTYGAAFAVLHAVYEPTLLFFVQFALLLSYVPFYSRHCFGSVQLPSSQATGVRWLSGTACERSSCTVR
jgi:hypothetical protein